MAEAIPFDFSTAGFRDPQRAEQNMARVRERVSPGVAVTLLSLLAECGNPDAALNLFERLAQQASSEVLNLLDRHLFLIHYAVIVFATSQWLGETLIQNTDLFAGLVRDRGLDRLRSREEFRENFARIRSRSFETDISLLLARFKKREYVRIMLRDVLGIATLSDTAAEISALSDMLVEEALRECESSLVNRYGPPQHTDPEGRLVDTPFTVLSLGKLGGNELNYSSDVDLMFLYGDGPDAGSSSISNREFFIRLAQEVTEVLSRVTREGVVFRIDLRLRPQGSQGEPAVPLGHALRYYGQASAEEGTASGAAHDWELQALIKVRHSAGNQALARDFIRQVQPFVYRAELNFAAIETAMMALQKIKTHRRRGSKPRIAADAIDVKIDRGGIRDIEFLVQCLQRVYGGSEPWLRSGGTLFSLQKLHDKNHISGKDFHQLTTAYEFLRKIEHRLQLWMGQQTHRMPTSEHELRVLWRSVTGDRDEVTGAAVLASVRERMDSVAEIYRRIIRQEQQQQEQGGVAEDLRLVPPSGEGGREQTYSQILSRLSGDSPRLYHLALDTKLGSITRKNLYRFFGAACTSGERYASVIDAQDSVERALPIFAHSDYLTDILVRHPEEIAALGDISSSAEPDGAELFTGDDAPEIHDPVLAFAAGSANPGEAMELLRKQFRHLVFLSGARDVLLYRGVFRSLGETSAIADAAIAAALKAAQAPPQMAVMALGRLGTREFDILSDADLLFIRDESVDSYESAKAAERVMELLAAYTQDGSLFPVDARLRPHGAEGELVITPSQLEQYFATEAQAWEALSYTKLRHIAGDVEVGARARRAVVSRLERFRQSATFAAEVREMRSRLEAAEPGALNFKTSAGGFYDLDFIVSYLTVRHQCNELQGPENVSRRLHELHAAGLLSGHQAEALREAAEVLRTVEHVVRLVDGRARKFLPVSEAALSSTEELVSRVLKRELPGGAETELRRQMATLRQIYNELLA